MYLLFIWGGTKWFWGGTIHNSGHFRAPPPKQQVHWLFYVPAYAYAYAYAYVCIMQYAL